jgi:hypothetical protein
MPRAIKRVLSVELLARFPAIGIKAKFASSQFSTTNFDSPAEKAIPVQLIHGCEIGTAKYAVNTPVNGSTALPVISPLLFMSFALARKAE